jgi:hypothetical protein
VSFLGKLVGKVTGAEAAADGAENAAAVQSASADKGIAAQQAQFEAIQKLLAPYVQAGNGALAGQQNLIGLNGQGAQQTAIDGISNGAQFQSMLAQGNNSILQNASATGGLRGGNTQNALAQFSPQLLNQLIQQQYGNLSGISQIGLGAATGTGAAGQNSTNAITGLYQQQGAANAGAQLAQAGVARQGFGDLLQIGSTAAGFF